MFSKFYPESIRPKHNRFSIPF